MTNKITFSCKKCGSQTFKGVSKPKTLDEFVGAFCTKCGTAVTENDIMEHYLKLSTQIGRDIFKDLK